MKKYIFLLTTTILIVTAALTGCAGPGNSYYEYNERRSGKRIDQRHRDREVIVAPYYGRRDYYSPAYRYRRW